MGNVRFGIPEELAARIRQDTGICYAVESGTYRDGSTGPRKPAGRCTAT